MSPIAVERWSAGRPGQTMTSGPRRGRDVLELDQPMDAGLVALRLAHVVAGAAWVGGAFTMILLVTRTARLRGPDGDLFMSTLLTEGKAARYFELAALTTVVAGSLLYWRASNGLQLSWVTSGTGIAFSIGAGAAIVSLIWGGLAVGPAGKRAKAIQDEIEAAGGASTAAQRDELEAIKAKLSRFAMADLVLLGTAVIMMATARYL
jgi:hypothetical protein